MSNPPCSYKSQNLFFLEIQLLVHLGLPLLFPVHLPLSSLMHGPAQSEFYCSPLPLHSQLHYLLISGPLL